MFVSVKSDEHLNPWSKRAPSRKYRVHKVDVTSFIEVNNNSIYLDYIHVSRLATSYLNRSLPIDTLC